MILKKASAVCMCALIAFSTLPIAAVIESENNTQQNIEIPALKLCEICCEEKTESVFSTLQCGHTYCTECLERIIEVALKAHSANGIKCPNCTHAFSYQEALSIIKCPEIQQVYTNTLTFEWARQQEHLKQCPTPDCTFYFINESTCALPMACPLCSKEYCNQCLLSHPEQTSCTQARADRETQEEQANNEWKHANAKECPHCTVSIEKNEGCNYANHL